MRIISGTLKGKTISFLRSSITRPLKDSVKENIFNIIYHSKLLNIKLEKSNILDLYSGIGSFGLECISRGARKVVFVEKNKKAIEILNKNLLNLSIKNKAIIIMDEIENFLKDKLSEKFDIIFVDPPFADKAYIQELKDQKKIKTDFIEEKKPLGTAGCLRFLKSKVKNGMHEKKILTKARTMLNVAVPPNA